MSTSLIALEGFGPGSSVASIVLAGFSVIDEQGGGGEQEYPVNRMVNFDTAACPVVTGDTFSAPVVLLSGDGETPYAITGAAVQVAVVSPDHTERWCAPVTQNLSLSGNNPASGVLRARLPADSTLEVVNFITGTGMAKLEIQVTDANGINTWFADLYVVKGNIG